MSHSSIFEKLQRTLRIAHAADTAGISSCEAVQRAHEAEARQRSRREFLAQMGLIGAAGLAAACEPRIIGRTGRASSAADVGIVGAGLAGLACADRLQQSGILPSIYEASARVGGRQWSMQGFFGGQTIERGGELIDNLHKTMLGYVQRFNLPKENYHRNPGEVFYYFGGRLHPESAVVDEYRAFVAAMRSDLRTLSGAPTADVHNDADVTLDRTSLRDYLVSRRAGSLLQAVIEEAYVAEYGLEAWEQSCLNFLLFIHADKRAKFTPFGVFSDERYHVTNGNDGIANGLASGLVRPVEFGMSLMRVRKTPAGRIELTFRSGGRTVTRTHDFVVIAIPFSVLREIDLDASLELPTWKLQAIRELGYGNNAKMMVAFNGRPWSAVGSNGASYSDLENHQTTWETNWTLAANEHGVLTDYSGGQRGARLDPTRVAQEAEQWLVDANRVFAGAQAAVARDARGRIVAHLEHWPSNPLTLGSYTCYKPGQFTTIAGNEGKPVGNLHFAGEHADSFYEWQGFMEGACLSGLQAAGEILAKLKRA